MFAEFSTELSDSVSLRISRKVVRKKKDRFVSIFFSAPFGVKGENCKLLQILQASKYSCKSVAFLRDLWIKGGVE